MRIVRAICSELARDEEGATAIEYCILAAFIALAVVASIGSVGSAVERLLGNPELLAAFR